MDTNSLKKTPLWDIHKTLGARLVPFAGYDMPVQYSGVIDEHLCVRQNAGLFDVSHMGVVRFEGPAAADFLNRNLTRDLSLLGPGKAAYTLLCRSNGGTVDDLIVYRESEQIFYAVLNASNKDKDLAFLKELAAGKVKITPLFETYSLLALQGPKSVEILKKLGFEAPWPAAFSFLSTQLKGIDVKLAFTGYTGELGCEIFVDSNSAAKLWSLIFEAGAPLGLKPCGLAARDTLRTEMGYSLYGHELSEDINPVEAGLSWAIGFSKAQFLGREALLRAKESPSRKLIALKSFSKQAPRAEMKVLDSAGQICGVITSGTFAPSLGHAIGLALVDFTSKAPYFVDVRGTHAPFEICKRPFYRKSESSIASSPASSPAGSQTP